MSGDVYLRDMFAEFCFKNVGPDSTIRLVMRIEYGCINLFHFIVTYEFDFALLRVHGQRVMRPKRKPHCLRQSGVEPESIAWEAMMITATLLTLPLNRASMPTSTEGPPGR
jgi:hypothetical protein